jgi:cytochrome P450
MQDLLPFNDPGYIANPYAHWKRLRDEAPVYWSEAHRFWAITRYDDVVAVLHDPARFSSRGGPVGRGDELGFPRMPLIQDDPPNHERLRRILSKAFTPRITAERGERVREIAVQLMDDVRRRLALGEPVDLVAAFTSPFPVGVIAEILGIPSELHERLRLWNAATSIVGAAELRDAHGPSVMSEMYETLADLVVRRRSDRGSDLISALIAASESDESPLEPTELVGLCQLLWTAGNETTTNLLSNAALVLARDPALLAMLRDRPARIPAMVEELLRLESPVNCLARTANEDLELQGQKIRKGDVLMIFFAAANRDPSHFERAEAFDADRRPNDHVAFSHGIHFCLGSHLARLEARVGIELLGDLLRNATPRPDLGARIPVGMLRGWLRLPLELRSEVSR